LGHAGQQGSFEVNSLKFAYRGRKFRNRIQGKKEKKMKKSMLAGLAVLVMNTCLVSTVFSQSTMGDAKQPNRSQEKGKEGSSAAVSLLDQAGQLVRYARENESPIAMLTAVQIIRSVKVQEGSERLAKKQSEAQKDSDQAKEVKKGATAPPTFDTQKLLAEARSWAKSDTHVKALIDTEASKAKSSSAGTLGATEGPVVHIDAVGPRRIDTYTVTFRGGQVARVAAIGDGDTDLDLYIYDENGQEVVRDTDSSDNCVVQWTPKWTGEFRVKVVNLGYEANAYMLMTN
jgi:hypothetical protein